MTELSTPGSQQPEGTQSGQEAGEDSSHLSSSDSPKKKPESPKDPAAEATQETGVSESSIKLAGDDYLSDEEWARLSKKKRKMKFDNEEADMTLEEIARNTAINKVVTRRGQEAYEREQRAQEIEGRYEQFFDVLKKDPSKLWDLAERLGHNPEQIAIARAREAYEWSQKPEAERRALIAERRAAILEAEREAFAAQQAEAEEARTADARDQELESEITTDVKETLKLMGMGADELSAERIGQAFVFLYNRDGKKPSPEQVQAFILRGLEQDVRKYLKRLSSDPEKFENFLGQEILDPFLDYRVKKAEKKLPYAPSKRTSAEETRSEKPGKKLGVDDWFKSL